MSLGCCLQSLSSHDSPQMSEHVEGVQVVCEQPLHVQLEDRKKKYQWRFKVHSQVSSVLWRVFLEIISARGRRMGIWACLNEVKCWVYSGAAQVVPALGPATAQEQPLCLLSRAVVLGQIWLLSTPPLCHHK